MYIYILTNKINGKKYVGKQEHRNAYPTERKGRVYSHLGLHNSGCKSIYAAVKKYGRNSFSVEVIDYHGASPEALNAIEMWQIAKNGSYTKGYNETKGGEGSIGWKHSEETKRKISDSHKGIGHTDETRSKISKSHTGKKLSEKTKTKMSKAQKGRKHTTQSIEKMRVSKKNISEETRTKMRNSQLGKKHSNETKRKISKSKKGTKPWNKGKRKPDNTNQLKINFEGDNNV